MVRRLRLDPVMDDARSFLYSLLSVESCPLCAQLCRTGQASCPCDVDLRRPCDGATRHGKGATAHHGAARRGEQTWCKRPSRRRRLRSAGREQENDAELAASRALALPARKGYAARAAMRGRLRQRACEGGSSSARATCRRAWCARECGRARTVRGACRTSRGDLCRLLPPRSHKAWNVSGRRQGATLHTRATPATPEGPHAREKGAERAPEHLVNALPRCRNVTSCHIR
jgi:hypothetical protein